MLKIELELINEHHLEAICVLANNPNISRTSGVPDNCQLEHVYSWIHSTHAPKSEEMHFVIVSEEGVIGCCILKKINYHIQSAELSYWVGEPYWGKGLTQKAAKYALQFAFESLNLAKVDAHYLKHNNAASGSVLSKLGFVPDNSRKDLPVDGRFKTFTGDVWTFVSITRQAFKTR